MSVWKAADVDGGVELVRGICRRAYDADQRQVCLYEGRAVRVFDCERTPGEHDGVGTRQGYQS